MDCGSQVGRVTLPADRLQHNPSAPPAAMDDTHTGPCFCHEQESTDQGLWHLCTSARTHIVAYIKASVNTHEADDLLYRLNTEVLESEAPNILKRKSIYRILNEIHGVVRALLIS
jgi:hypothetical protein